MNSQPLSQQIKVFRSATDSLRDALILILIAFFILLYASVLTGWFKPVSDLGFLNRIEPIIFLIIGYYFGRLPSERNERMLKDEIARQVRRADAADQHGEQLLCEREMLEERMRNVKAVLMKQPDTSHIMGVNKNTTEISPLKESIGLAISILR